ncbi:MAG: hypothetical protein WAV41_05460 [Microgenomates group bacterium]
MKIAKQVEAKGDVVKIKMDEVTVGIKRADVFNVDEVERQGVLGVVKKAGISFVMDAEMVEGRFTLLNGKIIKIIE